jgi:hypothetical protein
MIVILFNFQTPDGFLVECLNNKVAMFLKTKIVKMGQV